MHMMVEGTASEIEIENQLTNAIENATSTTVKDLQSLSKRKAVGLSGGQSFQGWWSHVSMAGDWIQMG